MTTRRKRARTQHTLLNCDQFAELLTGPDDAAVCVEPYYRGFRGDLDAMREAWDRHRAAILVWWATGDYCTTDRCAAFCDNVPPWVWARGAPDTRPWAALKFDAPDAAL